MPFLKTIFLKFKANAIGILLFLLMATISVSLFMHNKASIDSKNVHITALQEDVKQRDLAVKGLQKELKTAKDSEKITEKSLTDYKTEVEQSKTEQTAAVAEIKRQMEAINDKYEKLPKNAVNTERKSSEVAIVRASGLWASYCLQEPTHAYCKK